MIRTVRLAALLMFALALAPISGARGQAVLPGTGFRIERLDPALDDLLVPGAALETLGDRLALTERAPDGEPRPRVCATNVAFGDSDDKGLYITACTHVFRLRMRVPGVRLGGPPRSVPDGALRK